MVGRANIGETTSMRSVAILAALLCVRPSILIVEDDAQYLALLKAQLQASGYTTVSATNGLDALAKARANPPWLILLDLHMPVMDGLEFRLAQIADPLLADIPVVMVSADHEAAEIGRRLGAAGVFLKAEDRRLLLDLIAAHVPE